MRPDDRDFSQNATTIPLARPGTCHAGQIWAGPPRLLDRMRAAVAAKIQKPVTPTALLHTFALLPEDGYDIRIVQELLGHRDVSTTIRPLPTSLNRGGRGVRSPLDRP